MPKKLKLEVGKVFGSWVVLTDDTMVKNNVTHWHCICMKCKRQQYVPLNNLMNGSSTQCKRCAAKEGGVKRRKGYEDISGNQWSQLKSQAKRKGIPFNIRIEEAWEIYINQYEQCAYTGKKIGFSGYPYNSEKNTAVLTRIDADVPYVQYNCQWIHKDVAQIKPQSMNRNEFLSLITDCLTYTNIKDL